MFTCVKILKVDIYFSGTKWKKSDEGGNIASAVLFSVCLCVNVEHKTFCIGTVLPIILSL